MRMNVELGGDFRHRFVAASGRHRYLCFKIRAMFSTSTFQAGAPFKHVNTLRAEVPLS